MTISLKSTTIKVLKELQKADGIEAKELAAKLKMDYIVVMSAINELSDKNLGYFKEDEVSEIELTAEGKEYADKKLPELRLFKLLMDKSLKQIEINALKKMAIDELGFSERIYFLALNYLKKVSWVGQSKVNKEVLILVMKQEYEDKPEQELLSLLGKRETTNIKDIPGDLKQYVPVFKKRKLIIEKKYTRRVLYLTEEGKHLPESEITTIKEVAKLTHKLIKSGKWKNVSFKEYDVTKPGPRIFPGRINPLVEIINRVRQIFFSMGFIEIRGPIIESAFYNFDALFQPQDHPAREMHDTFYLDVPSKARLPADDKVNLIAEIHENGGKTGSTGWGYKWKRDVAEQVLLRTHTTATTVRQLGKAIAEGVPLPLKVFSVDRVYRNEKVDFSHLAEFTQVEGIIIGENVTLADLRGTLIEFYKKMGFEKVVTRPGFFPYTEPSMEISVFSKELGKWMEIGGSGIFRPEVCEPWGIKEPVRVLAWGQGLERIAMLR
ncbi:MAG: phenylalanine--tRNA ligase subunit alpha, partial [Promethearchaeota archaeon]